MSSSAAGSRSGDKKRDLEEAKRPLRDLLKQKHLHESKVRDVIVDTFLSSDEHLGLEAILQRVRRKSPGVGFATVYRTMKLLVEAGLAHERNFDSGAAVYEVAHGRSHHDHLICETCGIVVEFVNPQIESLQEKIADKHGFLLRRHRHELFGLCGRCQAAKA